MVFCLELMPLPLTVFCFSKIQIGFTFLVPAHPGSPGQRAVKWVCVCVIIVLNYILDYFALFFTTSRGGMRNIAISVSVCLSACVSVRSHISKTTTCPNSAKSSVPVAVVQSAETAVQYMYNVYFHSGDDVLFSQNKAPSIIWCFAFAVLTPTPC